MVVIVMVIVVENGFFIFYCQECVGFNGCFFNVIKFCSMCNDVEKDGKLVWVMVQDDCVIKVGKIICKLCIDELL